MPIAQLAPFSADPAAIERRTARHPDASAASASACRPNGMTLD